LNQDILPPDSCIRDWVTMHWNTEVPVSYLITVSLTALGAMLRRDCYVDQDKWKVYPNQSVMLIGPSGVGKDTAINFATKLIEEYHRVPVLGGKTIESVQHRLFSIGDPAAAYIPAGELTAFFGGKDYQSGMVQEFTDLLSTNDKKDISTKGDLVTFGTKVIKRPTLTLHCGSTVEWLHKAMPDGTLEGGFLGRFLIVIAQRSRKHVPLPKYEYRDAEDVRRYHEAERRWKEAVEGTEKRKGILDRTSKLGEVVLDGDAQPIYANWYINRFTRFSKATFDYANRCRDTVLRLAMLCAISRKHYGWIEPVDVTFGIQMLDEVTKQLDYVVLPPTREAQAAQDILSICPATYREIVRTFGRKYEKRHLTAGLEQLQDAGRVALKGERYVRCE
jgi:energy-coupling factor transporter ATP-binding protein EcfA2